MGYQIIEHGNTNVAFRNTTFVPLSKLRPYVIEGSDDWQKMMAEAAERQQRDREAYDGRVRRQREAAEIQQRAQQEALEAQRRQAQEEAAERQRIANEQLAELQRKAREHAEQRAAAARRLRLEPAIKPFQSPAGLLMTTGLGPIGDHRGQRGRRSLHRERPRRRPGRDAVPRVHLRVSD